VHATNKRNIAGRGQNVLSEGVYQLVYPRSLAAKDQTYLNENGPEQKKPGALIQGQSIGFWISAQLEELTVERCDLRLLRIQSLHQTTGFALNLLLKQRNGVHKLLGPWRAPGNVNVDRNYLIYPLNNGVIVEDAA